MHYQLSFTLIIVLRLGDILVHGAPTLQVTSQAPALFARDFSMKDLYGGFFDGLDSWEESENAAVQAAFVEPTSTVSPVPTGIMRSTSYPPYTGPGPELDPLPIPTDTTPLKSSMHPYAPGLHKLVAVLAVVGVIGFMMLCCFIINEREAIFAWRKSSVQASSEQEQDKARLRLKHKLLMAERDTALWVKPAPRLPGSEYRALLASPPSPSDTSSSTDGSDASSGLNSPPMVHAEEVEEGPDCRQPKSKWSMTISDYGVSPRTSASTSAHDSTRLSHPPVLISPPQAVYSPISRQAVANYTPVWRYGHVRNQSAPVPPSIASSTSDGTVEGRSRSSSTSSGRAVRVRWK
ncbi:hypothetical protein APHAL10511_007991 [Amanita phalloides]|nr:hypothetical protein APHAL10511_007991 [Amanita phalloides]